MLSELFDLSGQVALVTGGNSGIGRTIALAFAQAGASVAIFGRNPAKNSSVSEELAAYAAPSLALEVDIA